MRGLRLGDGHGSARLLLAGEPHRLASERVVLAERMPVPVVLHEDAGRGSGGPRRGCPSCPTPRARASRRSARRRRRSARAHRRRTRPGDEGAAPRGRPTRPAAGGRRPRSAAASASGCVGQAPRSGLVDVAPARVAPVAGDARAVPAEVVGGGHIGQEVEAGLVAEPERRLAQALALDDDRRLAVRLQLLHQPGDALELRHCPAPRISYAGGTPAWIFSCSRTIPSSSASGRGGQPGTCTSTETILSTPWRIA